MKAKTTAALENFRKRENSELLKVLQYANIDRRNYKKLERETVYGMNRYGRRDWASVNTQARIDALGAILRAYTRLKRQSKLRFPFMSSVRISPRRWVTPVNRAHEFDIETIHRDLRERLAGLNFVAVIEPGLFPRVVALEGRGVVSWHVHMLVWGAHRDDLQLALTQWNKADQSLLHNVSACDFRPRSWRSAPRQLSYMLKLPAKSYTFRRMPELIDPQTGEVFEEHDRLYAQRLRPGEKVVMLNSLREFTLDELIVGGGEGHQLLAGLFEQVRRDRHSLAGRLNGLIYKRDPDKPTRVQVDYS